MCFSRRIYRYKCFCVVALHTNNCFVSTWARHGNTACWFYGSVLAIEKQSVLSHMMKATGCSVIQFRYLTSTHHCGQHTDTILQLSSTGRGSFTVSQDYEFQIMSCQWYRWHYCYDIPYDGADTLLLYSLSNIRYTSPFLVSDRWY